MLVACTLIYTLWVDSRGMVEGNKQHWERGKYVLSQDKDCLKALDKMSRLYPYRPNSLDDSGRQWKNKGAQVMFITDELFNLCPCNMFWTEARK